MCTCNNVWYHSCIISSCATLVILYRKTKQFKKCAVEFSNPHTVHNTHTQVYTPQSILLILQEGGSQFDVDPSRRLDGGVTTCQLPPLSNVMTVRLGALV